MNDFECTQTPFDRDLFYQHSGVWQGVLFELLRRGVDIDNATEGADRALAAFKKAV